MSASSPIARVQLLLLRVGSNQFFLALGEILMGDESTLHLWAPGSEWRQVAEIGGEGTGAISRLAVAPDGEHVAIVMDRGSG